MILAQELRPIAKAAVSSRDPRSNRRPSCETLGPAGDDTFTPLSEASPGPLRSVGLVHDRLVGNLQDRSIQTATNWLRVEAVNGHSGEYSAYSTFSHEYLHAKANVQC